MDKIIKHVSIDRTKLLDEAIFMLIEARRKCHNGFGPTAIDRIDRAIDKAKKVSDYLEDTFCNKTYPSADKMVDDNMISAYTNGEPEVGDSVGFHINYGRNGVDLLTGIIKEIERTPNGIDLDIITYKITYFRGDRKNTIKRSPKDIVFFGD